MQDRTNKSLYGGVCLTLLSLTAGCHRTTDSSLNNAGHSAALTALKTVESPRPIAEQSSHQHIVDNLVRAELLLERFEQAVESSALEGVKLGRQEIYPELVNVGGELLKDMANKELGLTNRQEEVLGDAVRSLKVVASLLKREEVRPTVFFSNVRSAEKNITVLDEARANLDIAKFFFAQASTIEPL